MKRALILLVLLAAPVVIAATLTAEEVAQCKAEGGCALLSLALLEAKLQAAFARGAASCRNSL